MRSAHNPTLSPPTEKTPAKPLANSLKRRRRFHGLLTVIAKRTHMHVSDVCDIFNHSDPRLSTLTRMASALNCSLDEVAYLIMAYRNQKPTFRTRAAAVRRTVEPLPQTATS